MGVHVVLLTWAAQGHVTPVLQLAHILASQPDFLVTFVLTARAWARMQGASSPLPQQPNIRIQVIDDGLSPDSSFEQTMASLPITQQSLDKLLQGLMASTSPVTCFIAGTFCFWSHSVARKFDIPCVELWSSPAYTYCCCFFYEHLLSAGIIPLKGRREDTWITCIPGVLPMLASDFMKEMLPTEEEVQADAEKLPKMLHMLKESHANGRDLFRLLVNSLYDLESQAFDALSGEHVPACAIGPLFLHSLSIDVAEQPFEQPRPTMYKVDCTCLQWLDNKPPASTLYVAFGSESQLDKQDVDELAYGLEASGHSFLWVIRPGSVLGDISMDDVLPEGFQERVSERGLVVSWAPQTDVLAHRAIGGFLSHCGWNSTLEAFSLGVPILAWPQRVDQVLNKKYIAEEWKVGIVVEKNEEGKVSRITIEKGVRSLMQGEEGCQVRQKVKEVKEHMLKAIQVGGLSRRNLDQFIEDLRSLAVAQDGKNA